MHSEKAVLWLVAGTVGLGFVCWIAESLEPGLGLSISLVLNFFLALYVFESRFG